MPSIPMPGFMSSDKSKDSSKSDKAPRKPNMVRLPSGIEVSGGGIIDRRTSLKAHGLLISIDVGTRGRRASTRLSWRATL